jgi:hypothetical protein
MEAKESKPRAKPADATDLAENVAHAHQLLKSFREKLVGIGHHHPELDEAITKLEMALSLLTVKTGGML